MIVHFLLAYMATIGFSLIFNVPVKELAFCGIAGAFGWLVYQAVMSLSPGVVAASFAAALVIAYISRAFSFRRKMPANLYMIPGVIPLVPGAGIYYTMYYIINGDNTEAILRGIETMMISGVIAIGLLIILSLPQGMFRFFEKAPAKQENKNLKM